MYVCMYDEDDSSQPQAEIQRIEPGTVYEIRPVAILRHLSNWRLSSCCCCSVVKPPDACSRVETTYNLHVSVPLDTVSIVPSKAYTLPVCSSLRVFRSCL